MVFKCQEDSFLKHYTAKVVSCTKANNGFEIILKDTILFPEGGGQPSDHGWLNDHEVKNVVRKGAEAIHFVEVDQVPLQAGELVHQKLDWERRFDHMQQHSGQHLITAIFDREFGFSTKSWWLGTEDSYVDLDTKDVTKEQMETVENICNQLVVDCTAVSVKVYQPDDPALKTGALRTRGLPDDVSGPLRVVTIDGIESNMCCGTHVKNLAQLQAIKLLGVEKAKNKCLVHFIVGNRILRKLNECYEREIQFNNLLNGGPSSHVDLIKKLQTTVKAVQKTSKKLIAELAFQEAEKFTALSDKPRFYCLHRLDGASSDFINTFLRNAKQPDCFFFLTNGDDSGKGQLLLQGKPDDIATLGDAICKMLDGKGSGKGSLYNAKVNKLKEVWRCQKLIEEHFKAEISESETRSK
ncbi:alanyl-tRNA editing protein Aarsd1-B [Toxorhynchites rutilus septentrionalis]|uniref:alanyl-tRNA editing protein Aarsd1-B n=1 Tax=Toxorhynchites rutilus septentrionalis TaxID=329112 RepID=UPI00247835D0|nr:alanyl-tRNA editing protein Aarsd1-B [Toxorhynchites rutilus septentrionalis]